MVAVWLGVVLVVGVALVMHKIVKAAGDALVSVQWQLYDMEQAVEPGCRVGSCKLNLKDVAIFLVAGHAHKQGYVAIFSSQKRLKMSRKL